MYFIINNINNNNNFQNNNNNTDNLPLFLWELKKQSLDLSVLLMMNLRWFLIYLQGGFKKTYSPGTLYICKSWVKDAITPDLPCQ